jgi:hypothetical protein
MTESIGAKLTDLCEFILPFYLSEAETETYPYAVYEQTTQEFRTKDGVYKITAESTIRVYSTDFGEAQQKANAIRAALDGCNDARYIIQFLRQSKDCLEDVWCIEMVYYVKQTQ